MKESINFNQRRNTGSVISWYNQINNKENHSFICFDICEFYPSISENLLNNALNFASNFSTLQIKKEASSYIQSQLYSKKLWTKLHNPYFEVTMGSFDGAETCELIGLYINIYVITTKPSWYYHRPIHRWWSCHVQKTPRQIEHIKTEIMQHFQGKQLKHHSWCQQDNSGFLGPWT